MMTMHTEVQPGDELLYLGFSGTVMLVRKDGTQVGVELRNGVPCVNSRTEGQVESGWPRQTTVAMAAALARNCGLEGCVQSIEGSIGTVHRVRILS